MSWERRGNQIYYYSKRRLAGSNKIDSTYWGSGESAREMADLDAHCRFLDGAAREQEQAEKERYKVLNQEIAQLDNFIKCLTRATFLVNGYHFHKGSLRKSRKLLKDKQNELTPNRRITKKWKTPRDSQTCREI